MSNIHNLQVSEVVYPLDQYGNILSAQEALDESKIHSKLPFYTFPPEDFATINERDFWRRDLFRPATGLLLPSLWIPDLHIYIQSFRHLIEPESLTWIVPAIFGQIRKRQVTTHRFQFTPENLDESILTQMKKRLKEIMVSDFPRIIGGQYGQNAELAFSCLMHDWKETMIEVPIIQENRKRSLKQIMFTPHPHRRNIPENMTVGRIMITANRNRLAKSAEI